MFFYEPLDKVVRRFQWESSISTATGIQLNRVVVYHLFVVFEYPESSRRSSVQWANVVFEATGYNKDFKTAIEADFNRQTFLTDTS